MKSTYPRDYAFPFTANMANVGAYQRSSSGMDFAVSDESIDDSAGPDYRWHSPHLQNIKNEEELINKARALLAIVNGAQKITTSISHGDITLLCPPETNLRIPHRVDFDFSTNPYSPDMDNWSYGPFHDPFRNDLSYCLFISRYDITVRGMLTFLGVNNVSWISLYALLDFIEYDLKSKGHKCKEIDIATIGEVDVNSIKLFKQTANNYSAIGPLCRHGDRGWQAPNEPMIFEDASDLILKLFKKILMLRKSDAEAKYASLNKSAD